MGFAPALTKSLTESIEPVRAAVDSGVWPSLVWGGGEFRPLTDQEFHNVGVIVLRSEEQRCNASLSHSGVDVRPVVNQDFG